jgi:alpha-L-arabinofuranosidase
MKNMPSLLALAATLLNLAAEPARITIQAGKPAHQVPSTLWGIFFEDINLSTDGGIYPELVRNRSFEDGEQPESWKLLSSGKAQMDIDSSRPLNPMNRRSLRVKADGPASLANEGYYGMSIVQGARYHFKAALRAEDGQAGALVVRIVAGGRDLARGEITGLGADWKYHSLQLTAAASDPKASLLIELPPAKGAVYLDMVSLLPEATSNGLRPDLAEAMAGLKPSFFRFPGGCWVEGDNLSRMYNWKKTVGSVDVRIPLHNIWGYEATHGIGYHEYLQMAEDLGAEPLFCINVGMSHRENTPMDLMGQWVQDALDAIEYANGPTNSVWGGLRARNGHPAPFNLKYLEIGNENGGPGYNERWPLFVEAVKAKHPEVKLIANHWMGGHPKKPMPEIVDEHYYDRPEWFMQHTGKYDSYDRNGPKIFVGEYAVTRNTGLGNLRGAIGEAAFMTGLERNSDVVIMAAYAPLFCNANHKRWPVNLINFDSARWYGIPSYHVQKLFSEHRGTVVLPTSVQAEMQDEPLPSGQIGLGTWATSAEFKDVKVTAPDGSTLLASDFSENSSGWKKLGGGRWTVQEGALRQTSDREFVRALAGDRSWREYTLQLKARKISGREGFLVLFHVGDDEARTWWNLGGWGNVRHGIEFGSTYDAKPGRIETGRWYDIKVQVNGTAVKCWLDGELAHDVNLPRAKAKTLFASATHDSPTGEIIVKVVNSSASSTTTELDLDGAPNLGPTAKAIVLTSGDPKDENTLEAPFKVAPKQASVSIPGPRFAHTFPGNSLTILRIPAGK